jgi:UPF0271 protein
VIAVDLTCDLGEGAGHDEALMPFVTSASVACGLHAGDPSTMRRTLALARRHGVAAGAHPGFADREGFGRAARALPPEEIYDLALYQLGALDALARRAGVRLQHVKPHGALYHAGAARADVADALAAAARDFRRDLVLVGFPGSEMERAAGRLALRFAAEAFVDRGYGDDGLLLPRGHPAALVEAGPEDVAARAVEMVRRQEVITHGGRRVAMPAQTLCLHGDDPRAPERARAVRRALEAAGVRVAPLGAWL